MNVWILVYGLCMMPGQHCMVSVHSSYLKEKECHEVRDKQNKFWQKNKIRSRVECIRASETLRQRGRNMETRAERDVRITRNENHDLRTNAEFAVAAIERDICDRRGLKSEWAQIDDEVIKEIKEHWIEIINICFKTKSVKEVPLCTICNKAKTPFFRNTWVCHWCEGD